MYFQHVHYSFLRTRDRVSDRPSLGHRPAYLPRLYPQTERRGSDTPGRMTINRPQNPLVV